MYHIEGEKQKKDIMKHMRREISAKRLPKKYILKYCKVRICRIARAVTDELTAAFHEARTVSKGAAILAAVSLTITALALNMCVMDTEIDGLNTEKKQLTQELSTTKEELEESKNELESSIAINKIDSASKDSIIAEKDEIIKQQQSSIEEIESEKEDIIKDFTEQIDNIDFTGGASSRSSSELESAAGHIAETEMLIRDALGYTEEADALVARLDLKIEEIKDISDRFPDYYPTVGTLTSRFGYRRDPITGETRYHSGNDIANSVGTAIWAAGKGEVISAGYSGDYGNCILIDHGNGLVTRYGHLSQILVSVGDTVGKGDKIALMGATGRVTGPHLHFEVLLNGERVSPDDYI